MSSGSVIWMMIAPAPARSLEVVQEWMQIVLCIDDIWKTEHVLHSWFVDGRYGFLLRRLSRGGVPDLEFDGMSGVLPRSDSSNDKGFTFDEPS